MFVSSPFQQLDDAVMLVGLVEPRHGLLVALG
jgi:hypothetical protein